MEHPKKIYVLDTSAILSGQLEGGSGRYLTCQGVVEEVKFGNLGPERVEAAVNQGLLRVVSPSREALEEVSYKARLTGDLPSLSNTDVELLAVALDEKKSGHAVALVSDDYSIQNTAHMLKLQVFGTIHPGIRKPVQWSFRCEVCGSIYEPVVEYCPSCGGKVRKTHVK